MKVYRTHTCGELTLNNNGEDVLLSGWINKKRDHGNLLFVDLRDNYGITQCVIDNKNNYIVVDFGTATNFDVISANSYNGGVIAPGINLSLENLSKKAFLIPNVKFKKSNNVVGKNTLSAINSGFFFGYSGLIDNIIHSIIKQTKKKYKIIFTGGLAKMFKNSLKLRVKIKSDLTTDGVLKAAMYLNK